MVIWSSFSDDGYAQAIVRSESGKITGPWKHDTELLYSKDGGHGMIFRALDGKLYLTLHTPNEKLKEHPIFIPLKEDSNNIMVPGE